MCNNCTGLAIQADGELTEFGKRLAEYHEENNSSNILFGGISDKEKAKEAREELGIPLQCPHESYSEEINQCLFHLSIEDKERIGISSEEVNQAFIQSVQELEPFGENKKIFVNSKIREVDLQYLDLDSPDNRPIDFRFAHIEELYLDNTTLHEKIKLDYSTINGFSCQSSMLLNGIDAESAKINESDLNIIKTRFGGEANFTNAHFYTQRFLFNENLCEADVSFKFAKIFIEPPKDVGTLANDENVSFNGCEFRGDANFSNIGIESVKSHTNKQVGKIAVENIKITLRYCDYLGDSVSFSHAKFGSWKFSEEAINDREIEHENELSTISFTKSDFSESSVDFSSSLLGGNVELPNSDFTRAEIDMDNAVINGDLVVTDSKFSDKTVDFYNIDVHGSLNFQNCLFEENKKVRFEDFDIKSNAIFKNVIINSKEIVFRNFDAKGDLTFSNGQLQGNKLDYSNIDIDKQVCFKRATLVGQNLNFVDMNVGTKTLFNSATVESERINFSNADFKGETDFSFIQFNSRSVRFNNSTFHDQVVFANADFTGRVIFEHTGFLGDRIDFSEVDAKDAELQFVPRSVNKTDGGTNDSSVISFNKATIPEGRFVLPNSSETYYDFTEATVGDVELKFQEKNSKNNMLFEQFIFYETEFDGFDFSKSTYRKELKENGWRLESTNTTSETEISASVQPTPWSVKSFIRRANHIVKSFGKKYGRLLREGSDPDPDDKLNKLESTYRKAKIGADKQGDSDASSKFFQKELNYRRRSHGHQAWVRSTEQSNQTPTLWERISRAWLWFTNWILWLTSGYGEKPKRVIVASIVVIFMFATTYEIGWALVEQTRPEQFSGLIGSLTLSAEMFTTIILGGSDIESGPIRTLSYIQGFIGSFFIALFVLTITRSVRR